MKTILVTGGAGFIGSNFIRLMLDKHTDYRLINVDALTYAGNLENLKCVEQNPNYSFIKVDIRNKTDVSSIFDSYPIDWVVNFAAESHVDRSILNPEDFLTTNIIGTQVLLEAAKQHWKTEPNNKYSTAIKKGVRFHQVSTDEVYGALGGTGQFSETAPLLPNSPYSASKASADLIVRAYFETFGMPITISRCSNNYGPYQLPEKLIPLMINNCINEKPLPVYGDGLQIRDWIHVKDHCEAIDLILHSGKVGEIYNIGANNERTNIEIVKRILSYLGKSEDLITYVKDRPGHDRRYAVDNTKLASALGWRPTFDFDIGLMETIKWYCDHPIWVSHAVNGDYMKYYGEMYG